MPKGNRESEATEMMQMIRVVCQQMTPDLGRLPVSNDDTMITIEEGVRISENPLVKEAKRNAAIGTAKKLMPITKCASCPECQAANDYGADNANRFFCELVWKPIEKSIARGDGFPIWCPLIDAEEQPK